MSSTLEAPIWPCSSSKSGCSARSRSMLLGLPTSMAEASVATLGARRPFAGAQELGDGLIRVRGEHDLADRQRRRGAPRGRRAHCRDCRSGTMKFARRPLSRHSSQARLRVVHHLRQQAPDVDAVGGGQLMRLRERRIEERFLHHALAIVERAAHGERSHIAAPARQLLRLALARPGPCGYSTATSTQGRL